MLKSQNGYSANDRSVIATYTVTGTLVRLPVRKGDVATVLLYVAKRFNREVERLKVGQCWGYAERTIRGSETVLSNHASGTAIDLNSAEHPLGGNPHDTFSEGQIAAIHKILHDCGGVVRWGGDYVGRKDGMHFEIVGSPAEVKGLARRIYLDGRVPVKRNLKNGCTGDDVKALQQRLRQLGFAPGPVDGKFGPKTAAAVYAFKRANHWNPLFLNKIAGSGTIRKLGGKLLWVGK